jgi:pimeloyl-ACP methyl ester carboxylesterase
VSYSTFYDDFSDMSVENLQFLNSEQALADLAAFVQAMNIKFKLTDCKWICFGGSYPGSLSAWFRLKFPHLVAGMCQIVV